MYSAHCRNDGDTGNGIETSILLCVHSSKLIVGMMEIPETGLRPSCASLGFINGSAQSINVGMMEIPETGLRLAASSSASRSAFIFVGMMEIPETGLRWRGEGKFLARSSVSDALLVLPLRAMAVSRKVLAAKGRARVR